MDNWNLSIALPIKPVKPQLVNYGKTKFVETKYGKTKYGKTNYDKSKFEKLVPNNLLEQLITHFVLSTETGIMLGDQLFLKSENNMDVANKRKIQTRNTKLVTGEVRCSTKE